jgi:hypothetical protein
MIKSSSSNYRKAQCSNVTKILSGDAGLRLQRILLGTTMSKAFSSPCEERLVSSDAQGGPISWILHRRGCKRKCLAKECRYSRQRPSKKSSSGDRFGSGCGSSRCSVLSDADSTRATSQDNEMQTQPQMTEARKLLWRAAGMEHWARAVYSTPTTTGQSLGKRLARMGRGGISSWTSRTQSRRRVKQSR